MDQSRNITLKIAEKEYSLKSPNPEMEQLMRTAAEAINQKLSVYDSKFPGKEIVDKLVFVTLNETVNRIAVQRKLAAFEEGDNRFLEEMKGYLDKIDEK